MATDHLYGVIASLPPSGQAAIAAMMANPQSLDDLAGLEVLEVANGA